ncbi:hypothetical protein [Salinisphaera sp. Q1T1-3]|uniref:non-homologous end-joining DNA ligase LigD n=1 Tax=Salinisphaera sp. Q1T1-3 TaxID=2321229 RepID=UPI000E751E3F|nr:hypothetical protein [Salinisphaera sp. Q1T1-3]RJS91944.1 hypothetical protein D3260_13425 [Salinisphaera sp. Q1T1-3]
MPHRIADAAPDDFTTAHAKAERQGRLDPDIARNAPNQTAVAPYAVRPRSDAPIARPLARDELGDSDLGPRRWHIGNILRPLGQRDCPWSDIGRRGQNAGQALIRFNRAARSR